MCSTVLYYPISTLFPKYTNGVPRNIYSKGQGTLVQDQAKSIVAIKSRMLVVNQSCACDLIY